MAMGREWRVTIEMKNGQTRVVVYTEERRARRMMNAIEAASFRWSVETRSVGPWRSGTMFGEGRRVPFRTSEHLEES